MSAVRSVTSVSIADGGKFDVDQKIGRIVGRARCEAEQAAVATRDAARRAGLDRVIELPTLASLVDRFQQASSLADRHDGRLALLLVDFAGLAPGGDASDREAGDRLVVEIAQRLFGSVRAADTVCRLGGDQFVVLLTDVAHDSDAAAASRHVMLGLDGGAAAVGIGCNIGISFYPDHGRDVETLIGRADAAMYCAKALGPGHCCSYSEAAVVACSAHLSVVSPVDQRHVRRASTNATEVGPNDELREINEELLRVSIRARDERDRAQQHLHSMRPARLASSTSSTAFSGPTTGASAGCTSAARRSISPVPRRASSASSPTSPLATSPWNARGNRESWKRWAG